MAPAASSKMAILSAGFGTRLIRVVVWVILSLFNSCLLHPCPLLHEVVLALAFFGLFAEVKVDLLVLEEDLLLAFGQPVVRVHGYLLLDIEVEGAEDLPLKWLAEDLAQTMEVHEVLGVLAIEQARERVEHRQEAGTSQGC